MAQIDLIGLLITVTMTKESDSTALDCSAASTKQIIIKKPDGTKLTKTAGFATDGTDGALTYTTISGDIDAVGDYQIQGYVVIAGAEWWSDIHTRSFKANL